MPDQTVPDKSQVPFDFESLAGLMREKFHFGSAFEVLSEGEKRIFVEEQDDVDKALEHVERYHELVTDIAARIKSGYSHSSPVEFAQACWSVFSKDLGLMVGVPHRHKLSNALAANRWDCDASATLYCDVARELGIGEIHFVHVPGHALISAGDSYFETTSGIFKSRQEIEEEYRQILAEGSSSGLFQYVGLDSLYESVWRGDSTGLACLQELLPQDEWTLLYGARYAGDKAGVVEICSEPMFREAHPETAYEIRALTRSSLGQHAEAIEDWTELIRREPQADRYLRRCAEFMRLGRWEESVADYGESMLGEQVDSKFGVSNGLIRRLRASIFDGLADRSFKIDEAENMAPVALLCLGIAQMEKGDYESAAQAFMLAMQKEPANPFCPVLQGVLCRLCGDNARALENLSKAASIAPTNTIPYLLMGLWSESEKEMIEAEANFNRALELAEAKAPIYVQIGEWMAQNERFHEARRAFSQAIDEGADNERTRAGRLTSLLGTPEAQMCHREAFWEDVKWLSLNKASSHTWEKAAVLGTQAGNLTMAACCYSIAIISDSEHDYREAKLYEGRAQTFFAAGDYQSAVDDYTVLIDGRGRFVASSPSAQSLLDPYVGGQSRFLEARGLGYFQLGKYDSAIGDFSRIINGEGLKENPADSIAVKEAYLHRSRAFCARGDLDKALEDLECVPYWQRSLDLRGYALEIAKLFYCEGNDQRALEVTEKIELPLIGMSENEDRQIFELRDFRARVRRALGDFSGAFQEYMQADVALSSLARSGVEIDERRSKIHRSLHECNQECGYSMDERLDQLSWTAVNSIDSALFAQAKERCGRFAAASKDYARSLGQPINPADFAAWNGDEMPQSWKGAMEAGREAENLVKAFLYHKRAVLMRHLGSWDEAASDYLSCIGNLQFQTSNHSLEACREDLLAQVGSIGNVLCATHFEEQEDWRKAEEHYSIALGQDISPLDFADMQIGETSRKWREAMEADGGAENLVRASLFLKRAAVRGRCGSPPDDISSDYSSCVDALRFTSSDPSVRACRKEILSFALDRRSREAFHTGRYVAAGRDWIRKAMSRIAA